MIRHFFLDKTNTIMRGNQYNMGLNPIMQLGYGNGICRGLIHFDDKEMKRLVEDRTFADTERLKCTLKMVNCMSVDGVPYEKDLIRGTENKAERACSFDLMLFKLPKHFDQGRGFNFTTDMWVEDNRSYSTEGSNWYFAKSGIPWDRTLDLNNPDFNWEDVKKNKIGLTGGIYPEEYIIAEYERFRNGEKSIVICEQHFDFGNENLEMDITDYVLDVMESEKNYGLCLCFTPLYEKMITDKLQYVGFFTDHTNTFFHPYLEVEYCGIISDDRASFTINHDNRLYLYVSDNGEMTNLDELPTFSVDQLEEEKQAEQVSKGVYCVDITADESKSFSPKAIYYDKWSNLKINGTDIDDVELEFSTRPTEYKLQIGSSSNLKDEIVPSLYGINDDEKLTRHEIREVTVDFLKKYSQNEKEFVDSAEYRLYVMDGTREYTVIDWQPVEKAFLNNFFLIHTNDLIPNDYRIDIIVQRGRERRYFENVLKFTVVSDVTERYE